MHARAKVLAFALLGMAVALPLAAKGASLHVGITIVEACDVRTSANASAPAGNPVEASCSSGKPYSVALGERPVYGDGRSRPAIVPDDGTGATPAGFRITTFTL